MVHGHAHEDREREVDTLRQFHDRRLAHGACVYSDSKEYGEGASLGALLDGQCSGASCGRCLAATGMASDEGGEDGTLRRRRSHVVLAVHLDECDGMHARDSDVATRGTASHVVPLAVAAQDESLVVGGRKAAKEVFLARGRYRGVAASLRVITELGLNFWLEELKDRLHELMMGSPRDYRPKESWSWIDVIGCPIPQEDGE